jgi:hypothetical protein
VVGLRLKDTHMVVEKHKNAKKVLQRERARCRDEKYAGQAGPPDCAEVEAEAEAEGVETVQAVEVKVEKEESVGGWDMVGGDDHLHSPRSCHLPCTSHTRARCTVS